MILRIKQKAWIVGVLLFTTFFAGISGSAIPGGEDDSHWTPTQGTWEETQMLVPDWDVSNRLNFGSQVAIDGDTLIVGTQFGRSQDKWHFCEDGCDWIYVYNRDDSGRWLLTQKLMPNEPEAGDSFGYSIALDEESGVIVAGNPGYRVRLDSEHPGLHRRVDQVHIFERLGNGTWEESAMFHRPAPGPGSFGDLVDVSGHTVVSGHSDVLYVFEKTNEGWLETGELRGSWLATIQDDTLVIGVRHYVETDCLGQRWTYHVFKRDDGDWFRTAVLEPQNETGGDTYTAAGRLDLSEDGKTIVMGSPMDRRVFGVKTQFCLGLLGIYNPGPMGAVGSGWIYEEINGEWTMTADIMNPDPSPGLISSSDLFGISVGVSENTAIFGSKGDIYSGGGPNSGAVYVYTKVLGEWILEAKLQKQDPEPQDWFGFSVGISADVVVAGADVSTRSGTAHVFEPSSEIFTSWVQGDERG